MRTTTKVAELYHPTLVKVDERDTLYEAATRMRFHEIGALAVYDDYKPVGIITERDLADAMVDEVDPARTPVSLYMSPGPATVLASASVADAAATMVRLGARHLPVSAGGRLVGMISARDMLVALGQEKLHLRIG